jgi:hypothetical protein
MDFSGDIRLSQEETGLWLAECQPPDHPPHYGKAMTDPLDAVAYLLADLLDAFDELSFTITRVEP